MINKDMLLSRPIGIYVITAIKHVKHSIEM